MNHIPPPSGRVSRFTRASFPFVPIPTPILYYQHPMSQPRSWHFPIQEEEEEEEEEG